MSKNDMAYNTILQSFSNFTFLAGFFFGGGKVCPNTCLFLAQIFLWLETGKCCYPSIFPWRFFFFLRKCYKVLPPLAKTSSMSSFKAWLECTAWMGVIAAVWGTILQTANNQYFPYDFSPPWTHKTCSLFFFPFWRVLLLGSRRWEGADRGGLRPGRAHYMPWCWSLKLPAKLLSPSYARHGEWQTEKAELI